MRILAGTRTLRSTAASPGLGDLLGARVLGEFGDDPDRYGGARARKNYAGSAPITRASGKKTVVLARHARSPSAVRRPAPAGLLRVESLSGGPRVLRPTPRPRRRTSRRPAPARQPPGWHPARLPEDRHPLRRGHRLGTPRQPRSTGCRLTHQLMRCLSPTPPSSREHSAVRVAAACRGAAAGARDDQQLAQPGYWATPPGPSATAGSWPVVRAPVTALMLPAVIPARRPPAPPVMCASLASLAHPGVRPAGGWGLPMSPDGAGSLQ